MSNQEAIAAIIAANTPLKAARYAADNPPAQEIGQMLDQIVADHDEIAQLRAEIENLKAANIALQYEVIHQAEIAGYTYELLNSLLRGTIKLSTGRAAIKKAMARLCPGALLS